MSIQPISLKLAAMKAAGKTEKAMRESKGDNINNNPNANADPDADLILGLIAQDERAFSSLMDRHMKTIHKFCFYMLGDHMIAEDITQTVFLKTWQNVPNWEAGRARLLTWMRRVANNACLDHLKKKKPIYTDDVPEQADDADTPFKSLEKTQQSVIIQTALNQLPSNQRAAITLSYYQEVSQKDGANILGVTEGAYESLLVRARKNLKTSLRQIPSLQLKTSGDRS